MGVNTYTGKKSNNNAIMTHLRGKGYATKHCGTTGMYDTYNITKSYIIKNGAFFPITFSEIKTWVTTFDGNKAFSFLPLLKYDKEDYRHIATLHIPKHNFAQSHMAVMVKDVIYHSEVQDLAKDLQNKFNTEIVVWPADYSINNLNNKQDNKHRRIGNRDIF